MTPEFFAFSDMGEMDLSEPLLMIVGIVYMIAMLISLAYGVTVYILQSLGMYTMAKRRGIHHPGLAWVPVANMWILGSISDQYQYVVKSKIRNRRKVLLGFMIAVESIAILFMIFAFSVLFNISDSAMSGHSFGTANIMPLIGIMGAYLVLMVLAIVASVFQYIACYDLFRSATPNNAVLFLILGIFFNFLLPFFIFACRKKDEGMPPRKIQVPVAPWTPAPPPPAPTWQQSVAPAEPVEEVPAEEPIAEETTEE